MLLRRSMLVWSLVGLVGLGLSVLGLILQGQLDGQTTPQQINPPAGFFYAGEPNEVVYLSSDRTTYHRVNCIHRTGRETQSLVKNLPKGATPCATCIVGPPAYMYPDPPPHLYWATMLTRWTGGTLAVVGLIGLVFAALTGPPKASFAPGFPVERGPE